MKYLLFAALMLTTSTMIAQTSVTWIGGAPGNETNWNDAQNWSNHQVPDELSNVIIKNYNSGHYAMPVLEGNVEVLSIKIHNGATLTISENAELLIDGEYTYTEGIISFGGQIINKGYIELRNIDNVSMASFLKYSNGDGVIVVNDKLLDNEGFVQVKR